MGRRLRSLVLLAKQADKMVHQGVIKAEKLAKQVPAFSQHSLQRCQLSDGCVPVAVIDEPSVHAGPRRIETIE